MSNTTTTNGKGNNTMAHTFYNITTSNNFQTTVAFILGSVAAAEQVSVDDRHALVRVTKESDGELVRKLRAFSVPFNRIDPAQLADGQYQYPSKQRREDVLTAAKLYRDCRRNKFDVHFLRKSLHLSLRFVETINETENPGDDVVVFEDKTERTINQLLAGE